MNNDTLSFEFECFNLPGTSFEGYTNLRLGLQQDQDVIMDVPANLMVAYFHFYLRVFEDKDSGRPVFKGPCVHGPKNQQFVYLTWGTRDTDGNWNIFRRLKIPLSHLTWVILRKALEAGSPLRTRIRMTDRNGEPAAGTINQEDIEWL
jgi:hypothetical protein